VQPDAEPMIPPTPHHGDSLQDAIETPVPADTEEELVALGVREDHWEVSGNQLIRHHRQPRLNMFFPHEAVTCPVPFHALGNMRTILGRHVSGSLFERKEAWRNSPQSHLPQPEPWTGTTHFEILPGHNDHTTPEELHMSTHVEQQVFQAEILMTDEDIQKCVGKTYDQQEILLASAAKRQKVEVKIKDLSPEDARLFAKAKEKEIDSWIATDTVRKILRNQVPEGQLLRSRWILTWKSFDEIEQAETGTSRKAKARLMILGYEDPLIDSLPRDSPTLGRDSRMLALQCVASHRWTVRSFDIRTAFLRGSRQDSRILGIEPPEELRIKMNLKSDEVCELLKGAYGLINAPLLWHCELKAALLSLGFIVSPMDPFLCSCCRKSPRMNARPVPSMAS